MANTKKAPQKIQSISPQEIISAYLELGEPNDLDAISKKLKISRLSLTPHMSHPSEAWDLLKDHIDQYVEKNFNFEDSDNPRDRLFDLIFLRLEALTPFKKALKARYEANTPNLPVIAKTIFTDTASDLIEKTYKGEIDFWERPLLQGSISLLYLGTLRQWFQDDSPSLSKTMRFLDQWLGRLEKLRQRDIKRSDILNAFSSLSEHFSAPEK